MFEGLCSLAALQSLVSSAILPCVQFFRLYADRVPPNLFDRLRYIIQVCLLAAV